MNEQNFWEFLAELSITAGLRIIFAAFILFVGIKIGRFLVKHITKQKKFAKLDKGVQTFIKSGLSITINILVIVTAAYILGVPMTSFIAILASAAAAIGLALQGALSNFIGGLILLIVKPFKVGDVVEAGGHTGKVTAITIFYTYLDNFDGEQVTLPNGTLTNNAIVNMGPEGFRRADIPFSVSYDSDIETVKKLLIETAKAHPSCLDKPAPPFARMIKQGSNSLEFELRVWCEQEKYWEMYCDLNEQIKKVFDENGIEIPYQQMDIHMR